MVAFRKVFPVLGLLLIMAVAASAANPAFQCAANAGVPPLVRAEGLAEPVGDLVLNCTGGPDGNTPLFVNVTIFLSTNVTSNILSGTKNESLFMIDDPLPTAACLGVTNSQTGSNAAGSCTANMWLGSTVPGSNNSIVWLGVPIVPPGSTGSRILRIASVRANATGVPTGGFIPGTITEYISITGSTSVPVANQPQTVAFVLNGLDVSISGTTGKQCVVSSVDGTITFTEKFQTAFRKKIERDNTEGGAVLHEQSTPGLNYITESMYTNDVNVPGLGGSGKANNGTRFIARFKSIQNGVTVKVSGSIASGDGLYAVYVKDAASDGSGGTLQAIGAGMQTVTLSGGSGWAVWEVVDSSPYTAVNGYTNIDAFAVDVNMSWTPNIGSGVPSLGTSLVAGNFAVINTADKMSASAPEPRFKENWVEGTLLVISSCRTILLFPFITNQIGFDTGIVISNTSSDPYSGTTIQQQGACTLYYYGGTTGGGAAPAAQTSQAIPTGLQLVFTLSGGGNYGAPGAPGFQGYMFAICDFQYAHGYAFVTKMGAVDIAHGYLALVVPDRTRLAQSFSRRARENQGEQLGY